MRKIKILLLTSMIGLILISGAVFYRGGRLGYDPSRLIGSLPEHVDMRISGVDYTEVTAGRREWTLKADTLRSFKATKLLVFDRVRVTFFTNDGPVDMTSDEAQYDKKNKKVRLIGQVRAQDSKGYRLTTQEVEYDVTTREASAPGRFRITGPKLDLQGVGLTMHMQTNRLKVLDQTQLLLKSTRNLL